MFQNFPDLPDLLFSNVPEHSRISRAELAPSWHQRDDALTLPSQLKPLECLGQWACMLQLLALSTENACSLECSC